MAITTVRLMDVDLTRNSNGSASATAEWRITTDDDATGTLSAQVGAQSWGGSPKIPALGANYNLEGDTYTGLYLTSLQTRRRLPEKRNQFVCVGNYTTPSSGGTSGDLNPNPLLRPAKYWVEFETTTKEVSKAYNVENITGIPRSPNTFGPIQNAAGQDYDDALYEDRQEVFVMMQKNFADWRTISQLVSVYDRTINSDLFLGVAPHYAKFIGCQCSPPAEESGIVYYSGTARIAVAKEPFYVEIVNRGYKGFEDINGTKKLVELKDEKGAPPSEPVLLKPDGYRLPKGQVGNYIKYRTREPIPYAGLLATFT